MSNKNNTTGFHPLDHDDFGSIQSKIMNVIDSNIVERDAGGKPLHTFPHPALDHLTDIFTTKTALLRSPTQPPGGSSSRR
jgi:hypothetical protein